MSKLDEGPVTVEVVWDGYTDLGRPAPKQELVAFMSKKTQCDDLKQFENLFDSVDYDGDGSLSYEELMMVAVNRKLMQKEERLWEVFSEIDVNNDGDVCPLPPPPPCPSRPLPSCLLVRIPAVFLCVISCFLRCAGEH